VAEAGLENQLKTRGKVAVSDQLAQKLAQFEIGKLWEALGDSGRATVFAVAAEMFEAPGVKDCPQGTVRDT
jgi:hypothetical protein